MALVHGGTLFIASREVGIEAISMNEPLRDACNKFTQCGQRNFRRSGYKVNFRPRIWRIEQIKPDNLRKSAASALSVGKSILICERVDFRRTQKINFTYPGHRVPHLTLQALWQPIRSRYRYRCENVQASQKSDRERLRFDIFL
jgi:hypothetical protein